MTHTSGFCCFASLKKISKDSVSQNLQWENEKGQPAGIEIKVSLGTIKC